MSLGCYILDVVMLIGYHLVWQNKTSKHTSLRASFDCQPIERKSEYTLERKQAIQQIYLIEQVFQEVHTILELNQSKSSSRTEKRAHSYKEKQQKASFLSLTWIFDLTLLGVFLTSCFYIASR